MYALVEILGKQYRAEKGSILKVDRIDAPDGTVKEFESVMLFSDGADVKLGSPFVAGSSVKASIVGQKRDRKVILYKYKKRKHYRRKRGHRQMYSIIKIEDIKG